MNLTCGGFHYRLERPLIMGIVNLTPDSFSGDGVGSDVSRAIEQAHSLIADGADLLDIGAESSRPGAPPVPEDEELRRLLPVLAELAGSGCKVPISVDTYKPAVMRVALDAGVAMINDIYGFRMPGAVEAIAAADCGLCVMHMQGTPQTMQTAPHYENVVDEVRDFLQLRVDDLASAGVGRDRIVVDPGFGFGKTREHNLALFRALPELAASGRPLLVGLSRKSILGAITGHGVAGRMPASITAAVLAAERGAAILRVHDVAATRDALAVLDAVAPRRREVGDQVT